MTAQPPPGQLVAMLGELAEATDRLLGTVDRMRDAEVRAPSLVPGWTRGHVLTHLARNADGLCVLVENAKTGGDAPMYRRGVGSRDEAIEAGSGRGLGDLRLDLTDSAERLLESFADFTDEAAGRVVRLGSGVPAYGSDIPLLRIREVEIHHVDLGLAYGPDDWSEDFARRALDQIAPTFLADRHCPVERLAEAGGPTWRVGRSGPTLTGTAQQLLAWLVGRSDGGDLTSDPPAAVPRAPRWS